MTTPTAPKTIGDYVSGWLLARPEYADPQSLPIDQVTDAALPDMPVRLQDTARRDYLRDAFVRWARGMGMKCIQPKRGDETAVFGFVTTMPLFEFVTQFVRPQLGRMKADRDAFRTTIKAWLETNPGSGQTVNSIIKMAREDDGMEEAA
jgi:hypothetical protein